MRTAWKYSTGESRVSFVFAILKMGLGDTGSEGVRAKGVGFNLSLKQKQTLSSLALIPISDGISICHRLKMREIESKGVASDQINGGSLMRFVKQRRSCSLGVQSRLSNLGLRGDRYYWSDVLLGERNPPFVPLISEIRVFQLFYLASFTYIRQNENAHTDTHTAVLHPEWMPFSQRPVFFILCPFTKTGPQSPSPSLSFILCAHSLNRWSPFDSVLFLPLSLWASASSYLPFYPESPDTPFILSLLRLCHCLHHALQGAAVNIWLYPAQNSSAIRAGF